MEIVDDQAVPEQIRLAALIQLKINIERRWSDPLQSNIQTLSLDEKQKIRQTLLTGTTCLN